MNFNEEREDIWNEYIEYLRNWVIEHSMSEHFGSSPVCFDEWQDTEYEEVNFDE